MNISKDDILKVNVGFEGNLRSGSSLDFALAMQKNRKIGEYKKVAYLLRAILVDHPFSDGNKRTATFIVLKFAEDHKKQVNMDRLIHYLISIAKKNIIEIKNIEWRIKNAIE